MYKKNKMLSAVAAVAVLSSGAMSFDMVVKSNDANSATSATIITNVAKPQNATYTDANIVTATKPMKLSSNDRGDTLIYPAFKAKDGWETKITVRNTKDVSVVAKAVLYDAVDSHELKDFNLYLSSHDVASFKIKEKDGQVIITTRDGSIMAGLDDTLNTSKAEPVAYDRTGKFISSDVQANLDDSDTNGVDGDFIISSIPIDNFNSNSNNSGYVIVYVMAQTEEDKNGHDYYHTTSEKNHSVLYKAYYKALGLCRGSNWTKIFSVYGTARNGTATELNITAPNVSASCDNGDGNTTHFTSPESDILFGEVSMSRGGSDPRSLLLKAKAIENYTVEKYYDPDEKKHLDEDNSQMMLWAPGEYASIQDRRITKDTDGDGYADYNTTGIAKDAEDMVVKHGYFSFNKHNTNNDRSVLIVTQPMKRALAMADKGDIYWDKIDKELDKHNWGEFSLGMTFYDEDENVDIKGIKLVTITSPANAKEGKLYQPEMAPLPYDVLAKNANQEDFKFNRVNGYADIIINPNKGGLPAIITEMVSEDINKEAQINWIYSATNK